MTPLHPWVVLGGAADGAGDPQCTSSLAEIATARLSHTSYLTNQVTELRKIKTEAVGAGEQAKSKIEALLERQKAMEAEKHALDAAVKEEVQCCICLDPMVNAVSLSVCPHKFCEECIGRAMAAPSARDRCPTCRVECSKRSIQPDVSSAQCDCDAGIGTCAGS